MKIKSFFFEIVIILLIIISNESFAQILNMSKGFKWDEDGFGGEVNMSLEDRRGNTEYFDFRGLLFSQYQMESHRIRLLGEGNYRTAKGEKIEERVLVHLRYNY